MLQHFDYGHFVFPDTVWNQLPSSFRQPHSVHSPPGSSHPAHITSSQSPLSLSASSPAFHFRLKTHLSQILSSVVILSRLPSQILHLYWNKCALAFVCFNFFFFIYFFLATLARLRWTHSVFEFTSVFVNSNFGNSNLLPFSRYWSLKLENSLVFPSFLVWCPLREELVKFMDESNLAKNWGMELPCGGNFIIPNSTVFDWFTHVTDGQTYGRHITR